MIGAGFTGLAAAYHLARGGARVAVLEADRVGAGASGRTGGLVLEDSAAGELPGVEECIPALQHLLLETGIDCGLRLEGCWELTHEGGGAALWQDAGRPLSVAGVVAGGTLDPGRLLSGLARAAYEAGASLHEASPVQRIHGGRRLRLQIGEREVEAERVLLALNAYLGRLTRPGDDFHPALTLALRTAPLERGTLEEIGLGERVAFYTLDTPYLWGRAVEGSSASDSAEGEQLIFGGGLAMGTAGELGGIDISAGGPRRSFEELAERVRGLHAKLAGVTIEHRWAGPIAFRSRRLPLLHHQEELRAVLVVGAYAGHGVALSLRVAELAARILAGKAETPLWGARS